MRIGENGGLENLQSAVDSALLETITRNGAGLASLDPDLPENPPEYRAGRLSRFKLVCPSKTASARARWRNKCQLVFARSEINRR